MEIMVLGTGAGEGYPNAWCACRNCSYAREHGGRNLRANSSILIDGKLLIDMTESALNNAVRFGVSLAPVKTLLITHAHSDHFVANQLWKRYFPSAYRPFTEDELCERKGAPCVTTLPMLDIFGTRFVGEVIRAAGDLPEENEEYHFSFHPVRGLETFQTDGYSVTALPARHGPEGFTLNYIVEKDGASLLYSSDTGGYDEKAWEVIARRRFTCVMVEATSGKMPASEEAHHMNLDKLEVFFRRLQELGCLAPGSGCYLTHMSPHWTPPHDILAPIMEQKGVDVAYDGQVIRTEA